MIAITGANGFVGRNLVRSFPDDQDLILVDYDFSNLSKDTKSRRGHIFLLSPKDFLYTFDRGPSAVKFVFHQGACTDTMCQDSSYMLEKNFEYTYDLIKLCTRWKVPLIYASSASVYGDGPFAESDPKSPKNIYAKSKSMIDDYVEMLLMHSKSQITGLRYFNVYGPLEEHKGKMSSVMNQFKIQIDRDKKINLFEKSSSYKRDFIFIEDIVKINKHFYNSGISGVFNCGTGKANSFMEIPKLLKSHYDFDIVEIPMPVELKDRYQEYTQADVSKLTSVGKYEEDFCTLEEGIAKYVQYWDNGVC